MNENISFWEILWDDKIEKNEIQKIKEKYNISTQTITSLSREKWIEIYQTIQKNEWIKNTSKLQNILWVNSDLKFWKQSWIQLQEKSFETQNNPVDIWKIIASWEINIWELKKYLKQNNITYSSIKTSSFDEMRNLLVQIQKNEWIDIIKKLQFLSWMQKEEIDGEIWRKTWKHLLDYIKKIDNWIENNKNIVSEKNIRPKKLRPNSRKMFSWFWGNWAWEIRVIPGYNINKIFWRVIVPRHRWEISYINTPEEHQEINENQERHSKNTLYNFDENNQNHEQNHISPNISQNIFWVWNPFDLKKTHSHNILNFWHTHDSVAWSDYHDWFDYTLNPLVQNISYTDKNKKIWVQNISDHETKISQIYMAQKKQKADNIEISSLNFWNMWDEDETNIFWNASWQKYNFENINKNTINNSTYGVNMHVSWNEDDFISANYWLSQQKTWESDNINGKISYGTNLNVLDHDKIQFDNYLFIASSINYQLKSFQCNSNVEYTLWQHSQKISQDNNCYNSKHSFWNYYENFIGHDENHEKMWFFYGTKIQENQVLKFWINKQEWENNISATYKFQY